MGVDVSEVIVGTSYYINLCPPGVAGRTLDGGWAGRNSRFWRINLHRSFRGPVASECTTFVSLKIMMIHRLCIPTTMFHEALMHGNVHPILKRSIIEDYPLIIFTVITRSRACCSFCMCEWPVEVLFVAGEISKPLSAHLRS